MSRHPIRRWLSTQATILAAATRWRRVPPPAPEPPPGEETFGYVRGSPYRWMPLFILLSLPADALQLAETLPAGWEAVGWIVIALTFYSLVLTLGVIVTMRERPHRVSATRVAFHQGALASVSFAPDANAHLRPHEGLAPMSDAARRDMRGAGVFYGRSGPFIEIHLRAPVASVGSATVREVKRLLVSADDREALLTALTRVSAPPS
jgi:hypothetical protein